jgi:hypothetical protein
MAKRYKYMCRRQPTCGLGSEWIDVADVTVEVGALRLYMEPGEVPPLELQQLPVALHLHQLPPRQPWRIVLWPDRCIWC